MSAPFSTKKERKCNRKLGRVLDKCPDLLGTDTVFVQDTVVVPEVSFDTITKITSDTVEIRKDHLSIRYVTVNDSIWIEGRCDTVEIIKEIPVTITKIEQVDVPRMPWWGWAIGILLLLIIIVVAILRYVLKTIT